MTITDFYESEIPCQLFFEIEVFLNDKSWGTTFPDILTLAIKKIQCFIILMFRSRSHHIDHQNIPDASREDDDAEDNGDHVLRQYFNEQFFFFGHGCVDSNF